MKRSIISPWAPNPKRRKTSNAAMAKTAKGRSTFNANKRKYARVQYNGLAPGATRGYTPNSVEKKVFDIAVGAIDVNTSPTWTNLCLPTVGADMTNRIGRKIRVESLYVRGSLAVQAAVQTPLTLNNVPAQAARMIILWDAQPNGALPAVTDVLATSSPYSQLNLNNRERFKILADKVFTFDPWFYNSVASSYAYGAGKTIIPIKKFLRLNQEIIFNGTNGGTVADIASNNLVMLWVGTQLAGTTDLVAVLSTRVRFSDV